MRKLFIQLGIAASLYGVSHAQMADCIAEVKQYEEQNTLRNDHTLDEKNIFLSYQVKTTNWDNETVVSNVRFYRKGNDVHFYSEQGSIFMDDKEAIIVVPKQKMLVINDMNSELSGYKVADRFFETRRSFIDSCKVVSCVTNNGMRRIALASDGRYSDKGIHITKLTYELNTKERKINSIKVEYDQDFGIKQLVVQYGELNTHSAYKFGPLRKKYTEKNGSIRKQYSDYEVVDNRTKGQKNKSK